MRGTMIAMAVLGLLGGCQSGGIGSNSNHITNTNTNTNTNSNANANSNINTNTSQPWCGNGIREFGEGCDCGLDPMNLPAPCTDVNGGPWGNCDLYCNPISSCGDGVADPGEECDSADHNGATCESLGLAPGTLVCTYNCTLDTTLCGAPSVCGNGTVEGNEECDLFELGGASCVSLGFSGGNLMCAVSCTFNTVDCTP